MSDPEWESAPSSPRGLHLAIALASVVGAVFAGVSTSDFMQFLDREVHAIHCSFLPGAAELGESGCREAMMSPYSSFFRESVWGGVPVSLWAMAVFCYLAWKAGSLAWRGQGTRQEAKYLVAATGFPVAMSVLYAIFAMQVGASCKVCIGMYLSSLAALVLALMALRRVPAQDTPDTMRYAVWFAQGVAFVAVLTAVYLAARPTSDISKPGGCGTLVQADDPSGVMIELKSGKTPAIEVLDPLCPECKAFDLRLSASASGDELQLRGLLFPLDSTCNWMVPEELHPGACAVSEAILCAAGLGEKKDHAAARRVLAYAFKNQERLRAEAKADQKAMRASLETHFPEIRGCLGGPQVKNKVTRSLRWAVANAVPVLTPQLFVRDRRMCDEDTDLGLDYSLRKMLVASRPGAKR